MNHAIKIEFYKRKRYGRVEEYLHDETLAHQLRALTGQKTLCTRKIKVLTPMNNHKLALAGIIKIVTGQEVEWVEKLNE